MGMKASTEVRKTLRPMRMDMMSVEARCSRTPMNLGRSPGAVFSDMTLSELMCVSANTVAATNHGRPRNEHKAIDTPTMNRSKW